MSVNTLWIIFLTHIFLMAMCVLEVGFIFFMRAMGIVFFDYDWYEAFHEWYLKTKEKADKKVKELDQKAIESEVYIIDDLPEQK